MHTKKANVAKEDLEAVQGKQKAQQNKQQSGGPQQHPDNLQGQTSYPQGQQGNFNPQGQGNYPQGQQGNYPQARQMGPHHGQMAGDPNQSAYPQGPPRNQGFQGQGNFPQGNMAPPQQFDGKTFLY